MSNHLEREFPAHRWQAVPPIRRDPVLHDMAEHYLARGRQLRSEAFRRTARLLFAAGGRALAQVRDVLPLRGLRHRQAAAGARLPLRGAAPRLTRPSGCSLLAGQRLGRGSAAP